MVDMPQDEILVSGEWRRGAGERLVCTNPANGDTNMSLHCASIVDVESAIEGGHEAMNRPGWRDMKPHERARILEAIADGIDSRKDELACLQSLDTGKTIAETSALVASAAGTFRYVASALETLSAELTPSRGDFLTMSIYEPMGVIGAITPWNSPIASDAQKVAPALAAGNAVVLKPAEWTPLVSLLFGRICSDAGLPRGLLSVLPGKGSVIGDAIVRHSLIKKVSFTGGTQTGRIIASLAAQKLMPVSLELGGKSPTIVCADADIEHAINGVLYGIFSSTGQTCIAGSRLFVARTIYSDFVARLVERAKALKVGDPFDSDTQVAPMVAHAHRDHVAQYVDLARAEGGQILCGGHAPSGPDYDKGAYYLPTIISGLSNDARVCREEVFGPVLVVMPFDDDDELHSLANDSEYGLAAGIWTSDYKRAYRLARVIEAGTVWINTYKQFSISTPFGGIKNSGLGLEKGRRGLLQYMNQKSLYWGLNENPLPWGDVR